MNAVLWAVIIQIVVIVLAVTSSVLEWSVLAQILFWSSSAAYSAVVIFMGLALAAMGGPFR